MKKTKVAKLAAKTAKRYPKPTVNGAKFVVRHRSGLLQSIRVARRASPGMQRLVGRASDPGFRAEVAAAMSALGVAAKRAQKVGATSAVEDKRIRELVKQAASHLRTAVREEPEPESRTLRKLVVLGLLAGGAYVALKNRFGASAPAAT